MGHEAFTLIVYGIPETPEMRAKRASKKTELVWGCPDCPRQNIPRGEKFCSICGSKARLVEVSRVTYAHISDFYGLGMAHNTGVLGNEETDGVVVGVCLGSFSREDWGIEELSCPCDEDKGAIALLLRQKGFDAALADGARLYSVSGAS